MDSFDNFQYDSASSYGGMGIVDDTSSVYTATTQDNASSIDLSSLSVSDYQGGGLDGDTNGLPPRNLEDDFDNVLDDLKDEGSVELPPHACRCVCNFHVPKKQN